MSRSPRPEADGLIVAIKAFQDAVDRFDAAAAACLGVNETDLRCLAFLHDTGARRPSDLADLLGLTRGATTTALRRLESAGYVERARNQQDARSHFVRLTETTGDRLRDLWQPIHAQGDELLALYSVAELRFLIKFMERSVALHETCREALIKPNDRRGEPSR